MLFFEWFDLPVSLFPDLSLLKRNFLAKSKLFHPDKFTLASEQDKDKALEAAGYNNQAFKVLNDLDSRLLYILEEFDLLKEGKEHISPDFLMKMMSFNEAILEIELDENSPAKEELLRDLKEWETELNLELDQCSKYLTLNRGNASLLKSYYFKRKYYLRIKNNLSKFVKP